MFGGYIGMETVIFRLIINKGNRRKETCARTHIPFAEEEFQSQRDTGRKNKPTCSQTISLPGE